MGLKEDRRREMWEIEEVGRAQHNAHISASLCSVAGESYDSKFRKSMNDQGYDKSYVSTLSLMAGSRGRFERDEPDNFLMNLQNQAHYFAMVSSGIGNQSYDNRYDDFMEKRGFSKTWKKKRILG